MSATELELDRETQHVSVRLYFDKSHGHAELLDAIQAALEGPELAHMIAAYELVSDGFGRLVPDDAPLA